MLFQEDACDGTSESNTTPLIIFENGDVESKQSEHLNNIEVRSDIEDIMAELDDGYKIFMDRNSRVKYEPVQPDTHEEDNEERTLANGRDEIKDVHVEVVSTYK